ncbi:MAG: WecB/TagA/CpsF family glycosyltransferase [Gemmataceae bacterium]
MIDRGKHDVLGVHIDAVDYEAAVDRVARAAHDGRGYAVSALAVHGVMTGVLDREHRHRLNAFEMLVPDGQPVRWALNLLHRTRLTDRVYGPNLMLRVCARAAADGLPIFLFGGSAELLAALQTKLLGLYPTLQIAGVRSSLFRRMTDAEETALVDEVKRSGATILFIGLGCPRQEVSAFELRQRLNMPLIAVGAAFNFHAGLLPQAPPGWQRRGLEWLFRLTREPTRLWRRYLLLNPLYLTLLGCQAMGLHPIVTGRPPSTRVRYG